MRLRLFELDGTLVDTLPDLTAALNHALLDSGLPPVPTMLVRACLHAGPEGSVAAALLYLRAPAELRGQVIARYRARCRIELGARARPYKGAAELLDSLRARGSGVAICTNQPQLQAEQLLAALGLRRPVVYVVGGDGSTRPMPHPGIVLQAIRRHGCDPAEALFVGDSTVTSRAAAAASVPHLWFSGGYGAAPLSADVFDCHRQLLPGGRAARNVGHLGPDGPRIATLVGRPVAR